MKKFALIVTMLIVNFAFASAKSDYHHDETVLPPAAKSTIASNFKAKVNLIKIEKEFGRVSEYEVILTDGTEISFDKSGNWQNVETGKRSSVPSGLVPKEVQNYIKKNHAGSKIVGIEKERGGYEVDLSNGIEIKFDKSGNFVRYDK